MRKRTRGQSTVEYAVLAAVVVGALLAMQIYMKRGTMGKLREGSDQIGEQFTPLKTTAHYEPSFKGTRKETTGFDGESKSTIQAPEITDRKAGKESIITKLKDETLF